MTQTEDDIVAEARKRLRAAMDWESDFRGRAVEDWRFGVGDSDNLWQWDSTLARVRSIAGDPTLTINKTRVHCLQIINDAKQHKVSIKISPTGDEATFEGAQVLAGIVRHIEYASNAPDVYDGAVAHQVFSGMGYWRVITRYVDDESFDQELRIVPVRDPFSVYLDPDIAEVDGSDARYGFVWRDFPRDEFDRMYPDLKNDVHNDPLLELTPGRVAEKHVRVVEYYRRNPRKDQLIALEDGTVTHASKQPREIVAALKKREGVQIRPVTIDEVEWFKIAGGHVVEKSTWPSKYIPLVRVPGQEWIIDGEYDCAGHVRALKDAQRMYNYWSSAALKAVALQPISPFIGEMAAFDGLETYWNQANSASLAWLPFNGRDGEGQQVSAPQRQAPPVMPQAFLDGLKISSDDMQLVTGQFEAQMGQPSNERSGVAIQARQRRGDNATYHFIDSLASAIRYTGRILIDMIPKVYDTRRVHEIMEEDGTQNSVVLDPDAPQELQQTENPDGDTQTIFNPSFARYAVQADVGPNFGTRRQEAFSALTQIIQADPSILSVAGDLIMKVADFPMADELAERLANMVPPQATGKVNPQVEAAQQQIQHLQGLLSKVMNELADRSAETKGAADKHAIEEYRAETDRMHALKDIDPDALKAVIRAAVTDALGTQLPNLQQQLGLQDTQTAPAAPPGGA